MQHLIEHIKENLEELKEGIFTNISIARTFTKIPKHIDASDISTSRLLLMTLPMVKFKLTSNDKLQEFSIQNLEFENDTPEMLLHNYNFGMFGDIVCSFVKTNTRQIIKEVDLRASKKLSAKIMPNFMRNVEVDQIELNVNAGEACVSLTAHRDEEESDGLRIRVMLDVKNNKVTVNSKRSKTIS